MYHQSLLYNLSVLVWLLSACDELPRRSLILNDASLVGIGDQSELADLGPLDSGHVDSEVTDLTLRDESMDSIRRDMEQSDADLERDLELGEDATLDATLELDVEVSLDGGFALDSSTDELDAQVTSVDMRVDAELFIGCGDGVIQPELGETCDERGESATCNADTLSHLFSPQIMDHIIFDFYATLISTKIKVIN